MALRFQSITGSAAARRLSGRSVGGDQRGAADFYPAFVGVAMISLLSVPFFLKMSPDAGAEVSGRSVER